MKQYTTKWAKEYLREHPNCLSINQNSDMSVHAIYPPENESLDIFPFGYLSLLAKMLEHPDGWKKSKITRGDL